MFLLFLWNSIDSTLEALDLEAEGQIGFTYYKEDGTQIITETNFFGLKLSDNKWSITIYDNDDKLPRHEHVFDGTNITSVTFNNNNTRPAPRVSNKKVIYAKNTARIYQSLMPVNEDSNVGVIWLAYCSTNYLYSLTNSHVKPVVSCISSLYTNNQYYENASWHYASNYPPWLEYMEGFSTGTNFVLVSNMIFKPVPAPYPFNSGYRRSIYAVNTYTNVAGLFVPDSFKYEGYVPIYKEGTNSHDVRKDTVYAGIITSLRVAEMPSIAATLDGATFVSDKRSDKLRKPLAYIVTTNWITTNDAKYKALLAHNLKRQNAPLKLRKGPSEILLAGLLVLTVLCPPVYLAFKHFSTGQNKPQNNK
jgi:hypothetical protein